MDSAVAGQRHKQKHDVNPSHEKATLERLFEIEWPDPKAAQVAAKVQAIAMGLEHEFSIEVSREKTARHPFKV